MLFTVISPVTVCPISPYSCVLLISLRCFVTVSFPLRNTSLNMEMIADDGTNSTFNKNWYMPRLIFALYLSHLQMLADEIGPQLMHKK